MLTVAQVSQIAGVTPRTLHYYDEIALLEPTMVGENGYRYYDEAALLRLQQILLYRELEIPLAEIRTILEQRDFDVVKALGEHRAHLRARVARLQRLMATIDETILHIQEERPMNESRIFAGFSDEEQERYAAEAERRWDPEIVRESNRRWKNTSEEERRRIQEEGNRIYADLAKAIDDGPGAATTQACIARWHDHMQHFWSPEPEQLLGLAELYNSDERFRRNLAELDPRLPPFMREAVSTYVKEKRNERA